MADPVVGILVGSFPAVMLVAGFDTFGKAGFLLAIMFVAQVAQIFVYRSITRRSLYAQLAVRRGVTPQEVAITAGCSLLATTPVGGVYWLSDESPRRRLAGQRLAIPDYCR